MTETKHTVAVHWARVNAMLQDARRSEQLACEEVNRLSAKLLGLSAELQKTVGSNVTARLFQISPIEAVLVEHDRPVRLVAIEDNTK
jgi:hypothetical protein